MPAQTIEAEDTITRYELQVRSNGRWVPLAGHTDYDTPELLAAVFDMHFAGAEAEYRQVKVVTTRWLQVIGP